MGGLAVSRRTYRSYAAASTAAAKRSRLLLDLNTLLPVTVTPMTPEQEAEAIRLCEDLFDRLNQIAAVLETFLADPSPDFSSLQIRTLRSPPLVPTL